MKQGLQQGRRNWENSSLRLLLLAIYFPIPVYHHVNTFCILLDITVNSTFPTKFIPPFAQFDVSTQVLDFGLPTC